jgi:uncharacterized protein YggE
MIKQRVLLLLLFVTCHAFAWDLPHISIIGTGEAIAKPDQITWKLSVQSSGLEIDEVASNHLHHVDRLLHTLGQFEPNPDQRKTSRIGLKENWVYRNNNRLKEGYIATTTVTLQTQHIDTYIACWKAISQLKNVTVENVHFSTAHPTPHLILAHKKAIQNARKQARLYARQLGVTLLEPLELTEINTFSPRPSENTSAIRLATTSGDLQPIAPGQQIFRARVRATYRISN